jgi:hypothetical protein
MFATSKRTLCAAGLCAAAVIGATPAWADAVTQWNETAEVASLAAGGPPLRNRVFAMAQVAVHDALNAIDPRFETYSAIGPASPGASPEAAVAAATYRVLLATVPSQAGTLTLLYSSRISEIDDCPSPYPTCIEDGIAAGEAAAAAILALRSNDGSATPNLPYTLPAAPGVYQFTPPTFGAPQFAGWARVTPFVLNSGSQFRAEPSEIFDLTGEAYTRDYNEVKRVGATNSEANGHRTPDQSAIARFWPGGGANWNAITRLIAAGRGLDEWQHARLFALLNMAISDGSIAVYDTKYTYNFWRPVTAIRAGDTDGNPDTVGDSTWSSYQATPLYPDYTCGLTNTSGAATEVLRRAFGDRVPYTFTAAGMTRSYASLTEAAAESVDARVFGGMHFRTGCVRGVIQGEQVGRFVVQHALKPLHGNASSKGFFANVLIP